MTFIIGLLRSLSYDGRVLTLDRPHYYPHFTDRDAQGQLALHVAVHVPEVVLSAGGPYVLHNISHEPSLAGVAAAERQRFVDFAEESIRLAPAVGARTIMLHSGTLLPGTDSAEAWQWLLGKVAYLA